MSRTATKNKHLSKNFLKLLEALIQVTLLTPYALIELSINLQVPPRMCGQKIQRSLTLQFTLRAGGMLSVVITWTYTDPPEG